MAAFPSEQGLSDEALALAEGEKKDSYLSIPSLSAYVMFENETRASVTSFAANLFNRIRCTKFYKFSKYQRSQRQWPVFPSGFSSNSNPFLRYSSLAPHMRSSVSR